MYYGYNDDDEITVNESTATVNNVEEYDLDNLMESVISSYINDYTIFEATLKRDFLEVRGVLTEEAEGNLLKTLWEKIVGVFTRIKEAITKAIESLCAKIDEIKTSRCQKIVEKYDSLYSRENGELDELSIDNFYPWKEDVHVEFTFAFMYSDDITTDKINKRMSEIKDKKTIKSDVHKKMWSETKVEYPFKEDRALKNKIKNIILNKTLNINVIKKLKKVYIMKLDGYEKQAQTKLKEVKSNKSLDKEQRKDQVNKAQLYLKMVSKLQGEVGMIVSAHLKETGKQFKEACRLYAAGGKFLEGKFDKSGNSKSNDTKETKKEKEKTTKKKNDSGFEEMPPEDKTPKSKEDFDKIRRSAIDASFLYNDMEYINAFAETFVFELGLDF